MKKFHQKNIINQYAEAAVVELATIFNSIAYISSETLRENIYKAQNTGMPRHERTLSKELANYLLSNFSLIYAGLIVNSEFRDTFKEAVSIEIALDSKEESCIQKIRTEMMYSMPTAKQCLTIDLSTYNDDLYKRINKSLSASFERIMNYSDILDELINELSDDDMLDIGFCISNFMFLIRAFSQNTLFTNYVKTVIESVEKKLSI